MGAGNGGEVFRDEGAHVFYHVPEAALDAMDSNTLAHTPDTTASALTAAAAAIIRGAENPAS